MIDIEAGRAAVKAADKDGNAARGDLPTAYTDALAGIMHAADADGVDFEQALIRARQHHADEVNEGELPPSVDEDVFQFVKRQVGGVGQESIVTRCARPPGGRQAVLDALDRHQENGRLELTVQGWRATE